MFSADFGGGALGEYFATEHPTWEEYGRSGEAFFPETGTSITTAEQAPPPDVGMYGYEQFTFPPILGAGYSALTGTLGAGYETIAPVAVGVGGEARALIAEQLRLEEAAKLTGGVIEYISDIPGEIGEAGGEFLSELGAGAGAGVQSVLEGGITPLTAIPGDLFEGIPTWVPLLGAAYLLTRK